MTQLLINGVHTQKFDTMDIAMEYARKYFDNRHANSRDFIHLLNGKQRIFLDKKGVKDISTV